MAPPKPPPIASVFSQASRRAALKIVGGHPPRLGDLYFYLLRASWPTVVAFVAAVFGTINALYATFFWLVGGVTGASTWEEYFYFSVQTLATIGYGAMYPQSRGAQLLVTSEALAGVLLTAVVTGLCFAKFARPTSRTLWSEVAVVSDREGVPTVMFRVANQRMNHIVEANITVALLQSVVTAEGERQRKVFDMELMRSSTPTFILSWTVMHPITPTSPLYGMTPERLQEVQGEILLTLTGLDETLMQTIHARYSYPPTQLRWGQRFADILGTVAEDGRRIVDYTKFHQTLPATLSRDKMGLPNA